MSRFAFLVHPLAPFHRRLLGIRRTHGPLVLGGDAGIDGVGISARIRMPSTAGTVDGLIVAVPDLVERLVADQARALALEDRAAQVAAAEGATVIGLGNALAVVAGRGAALAERTTLPVTTGHAATAWACAAIARDVLADRGLPRGPIGILGFQGTVGDAVAALLARDGVEVWVEGGAAADRRAVAIGARTAALDEILGRCDVLVGASTTGPLLDAGRLRAGTTLVDLALPPTLAPGPRAPGVTLVAGETLRAPGRLHGRFWGTIWLLLAQYGRGCVYACLAEPMAMAITGETGFSSGRRLDLERVDAIGAVLRHLGYHPVRRPR